MRTPPNACVAAVALLLATVAACSNKSSSSTTFLDASDCFGFSPHGPALDDADLIDEAIDEWREDTEDEDYEGIGLADDARICVVYAGPDSLGDPSVALLSGDVTGTGGAPAVAVFRVLDPRNDDPVGMIAHVEDVEEDAPLIGVADGLWLLADHVDGADIHVGTVDGPVATERAAGPLVDLAEHTAGHASTNAVAVLEQGEHTYLVSNPIDAGERFPTMAQLVEGAVDVDALLAAPAGVPLLAAAAQDAHYAMPGRLAMLELLGTADVTGVGTVLASVAAEYPNAFDVAPMVHVPSESHVAAATFDGTDARPGWALGLWLVTADDGGARPTAYLAVAAPPSASPEASVELTVATGSSRETLPGPLAWVKTPPVTDDGWIAASIIATADGEVVPIITVDHQLTY